MERVSSTLAGLQAEHTAFGLLVDDVDESVAFYRDVMGYGVGRQSETFAQMRSGDDIALFFWKWGHLVEHLGEAAMSKVKHRVQSALRFDSPAAVDEAYAWLKGRGVEFLVSPGYWEWNAYAAYFVDEEGYMWELFTWRV